MKKTWIVHYIINILRETNKFFIDNVFDENIIK